MGLASHCAIVIKYLNDISLQNNETSPVTTQYKQVTVATIEAVASRRPTRHRASLNCASYNRPVKIAVTAAAQRKPLNNAFLN